MSTINERIDLIIKSLYKGNKRAFAKQIGVSATVVENVVGKRQGKPSFDVLESISANANINSEWLLLGKGTMMDTDINSLPSPEQLVSDLVASGAIVVEDKDVKEQMYESMIRERDEKIRQLEQEIFLLKNKILKIG